ncbi:MAG: hypothetical protein ABSD64_14965 [Terriglobales bacterium]|jgi:hypothetical protein
MGSPASHTLVCDNTDRTLAYWSSLDSLSPETRSAVRRASIIVVPSDGFREYTGPVFPVGTIEFFRLLRERSPQEAAVEIAVDESEYKEVALHSGLVRLAGIIVKYVFAPVASGMIVEYLKTRLGSRFSKSEVEASMIVDQSDGVNHKAWQIKYKGPASTFENVVGGAIASLPGPEPKEMAGGEIARQDPPK